VGSLIEKGSLTLVPNESFLAQSYAQGHKKMTNNHVSFADSESEILTIIQTRKIRQANAKELTSREKEVLEQLGKGLSVKGTAREISIAAGTVKWHIKNLYYKLGASSREDALSKARALKIIR
jgi:ATP/maltotriose-dependent transcriptional regulator MalT